MHRYLILITCSLLYISCSNTPREAITKTKDYEQYIETNLAKPVLVSSDSEIDFWRKKLSDNPNGYIFHQKLGIAYSNRFEINGDIDNIHKSNDHLNKAEKRVTGKSKTSTLLNLSSNAIKLHQFKKALEYAGAAAYTTTENYGPLLMQYDALMELGQYDMAISTLKTTKRSTDFDYLIRYAKYQDYIGQLDSTILIMEKALTLVPASDKKKKLWTLASLGDYYGHNGQIEKSYQSYLTVLKEDPEYAHAMQGIAWIAYAYDNKPLEAIRILEFLQSKTDMPDQYLNIAEIKNAIGLEEEANLLIEKFVLKATQNKYGEMYASYLIDYYAENNPKLAIDIALKEVDNRPTPATFTSLAWAYYHNGENDKAIKIIEDHVLEKSFEPELIFRSGVIAKANGQRRLARRLLKEAKEAWFELGPTTSTEIENLLAQL